MRTPWGTSQDATTHEEGIVFHSTASHGGFKLDCKRNALVPDYMRHKGGWYEEDCEWSIVATIFPAAFTRSDGDKVKTAKTLANARDTLRNWFPDEYQRYYGVTLAPGESFKCDERIFATEHANDLIVISALNQDNGMVGVIATTGGNREGKGEKRRFLVPKDEYAARSLHGFVIDTARHREVF